MTDRFGSLEWARLTGGTLSLRDKLTLLTQLVQTQVATTLARLRPPLTTPFDLDAITIPDSRIAQQALELCEDASSPPLFLHCARTFFWGSILGQQDGLAYDPELFYVMAQLHDLALTDQFHGTHNEAACFAVEGGRIAQDFCTAHGWTDAQAERVNAAITRHINIHVPPSDGVEVHLLRAGSGLDVIGTRAWEIAPATRDAVIKRYSRDGFTTDLIPRFEREAALRPDARTAFYIRWAQFKSRIANARV